jgi:hypothetical protein
LAYTQINREIIRAVSSNDAEEIIAEIPLFAVAVPTPAGINVGITPGAFTIINAMGLTITYQPKNPQHSEREAPETHVRGGFEANGSP